MKHLLLTVAIVSFTFSLSSAQQPNQQSNKIDTAKKMDKLYVEGNLAVKQQLIGLMFPKTIEVLK